MWLPKVYYSEILLSGKHFEKKKKNGLDFGNEIQPFSFIFVLTKKIKNDGQKYTFYRTADVWSANKYDRQAKMLAEKST